MLSFLLQLTLQGAWFLFTSTRQSNVFSESVWTVTLDCHCDGLKVDLSSAFIEVSFNTFFFIVLDYKIPKYSNSVFTRSFFILINVFPMYSL